MSTTYLITGGAGNLACQLAQMIERRDDLAVLYDIADAPIADTDATYVKGDITNAKSVESVFAKHQPEIVIHFASLLSGSTEANRPQGWRVNVDGAYLLFEAAINHGVKQVFFPSSLATYGGELPNPLPEDHPQWPSSLYGMSKVAVERLGYYYHTQHGLDFRSIRVPVVVSPFAPAGAASAYASHAFVESARRGGFTFKVEPETQPSLIYVKDVLAAILQLLDTPEGQLTRRVYNVQALSPTAKEIAEAVRRKLPDAKLVFDPDSDVVKLIESWVVSFDDCDARTDWGWSPRYGLDALADDLLGEVAA